MMLHSFKITLIITTYNRKDALELALNSVLEQSVMPLEVIVADDGSREDTRKIVESFVPQFLIPLIHCWQEDIGFRLNTVRNLALKKAKGEYIIFSDGDMVLSKNYIKNHVFHAKKGFFSQGVRVYLTEEMTKKILHSKQVNISIKQYVQLHKYMDSMIDSKWLSKIFSKIKIVKGKENLNGIKGCNMAFWAEDARMINGFNEDMTCWGYDDSEFVVRLINKGVQYKKIKYGTVAYHLHHLVKEKPPSDKNLPFLIKAIEEKLTWCENGLVKEY